jgi:hypothetical protein
MIRTLAALLALVGTQASALSCLRPDPLRDFREAQAAPEPYHVLYGTMAFDPSQAPQGFYEEAEPAPPPVSARFEGMALTRNGFTSPVQAEVTLQPTCAGPYCGTFGQGTVLLFAEVTADGYVVRVGPCGGGAYDTADQAVLDRLTACARGAACGTDPS